MFENFLHELSEKENTPSQKLLTEIGTIFESIEGARSILDLQRLNRDRTKKLHKILESD